MGCANSRAKKLENPVHVSQVQPDHSGVYVVQMSDQRSQQIRRPPSLKQLGYQARRYTVVSGLAMYIVKQVQHVEYLAILGIDDTDGGGGGGGGSQQTLFVNFVDMGTDSRGERQRPRLRQMLASFWTDTASRDLEQLRIIYYQNVTEKSTRDVVRDRVAALMGVGYSRLLERPHERIVLHAPNGAERSQAAQEAWDLACMQSKLVRSAIGLLRDFPMAGPDEELTAVQIVISPAFDRAGNAHNFDLEVVLGQRMHRREMLEAGVR